MKTEEIRILSEREIIEKREIIENEIMKLDKEEVQLTILDITVGMEETPDDKRYCEIHIIKEILYTEIDRINAKLMAY